LLLAALAAAAAAAGREDDLAALRSRLAALRAELEEKEAGRREAREALRASETAISEAQRALARLEREAREARAQMAALAAEREARERALRARQASLGRLLAARMLARLDGGAPAALRLVLSGDDPMAAARRLHYLDHLSRATAQAIAAHRQGLAELARLRAALEARARELAAIGERQRADRERLLAERRERRRVLERLAAEVRRARREVSVLAADERRLARVIEEIGKLLAARPGAGHRSAERAAEPSVSAAPFAALKGRLRLPVRGVLARQSRSAKGVFIRAPEGEPVRAVAAGRVVFADWMRGYGNLLIVDHGEDYLTVYGNNDALLKQVGETVAAGEPLAIVGASGGGEETGLYFEVRHLGRPLDPLGWAKLR
jgi:septal ring factor EnvC (AmiA/AmiB activator)